MMRRPIPKLGLGMMRFCTKPVQARPSLQPRSPSQEEKPARAAKISLSISLTGFLLQEVPDSLLSLELDYAPVR